MKQLPKQLVAFGLNSLLALSALAQNGTTTYPDSTSQTGDRMTRTQLKEAVKASDIIGLTVKNNDDQKLGTVKDLAVDVESGRIVELILSVGGFMGMDSTLVAVPPSVLTHDGSLKILRLNADKDKLNAAPKVDMSRWDGSMQSNQVTEVYSYYGAQPYFARGYNQYGSSNLDGTVASTLPRHQDGTVNTTGARTMDTAHNVAMAATNGMSGDSMYRNRELPFLGYVQRASKLMGSTVMNLQDEKIGKVENFVVDLSSGRIVVVVVSAGGYMGMGGEYSVVPPAAFQFNEAHDMLHLDATKDTLSSSPHFAGSQWPDLSEPGYTAGVYRAYKVEPYFTADADNTGRNVRDRDGRSLTPLDQGNSQSDINITAQIRKAIIADRNMSMNAKNIKIITANGQVTLRGPVNTGDEKNRIGEMASQAAQEQNVNNQLEVKLNSANNN